MEVTTANAGKLLTRASGTCYCCAPIAGTNKFLMLEMFDCLYTPDALVNLISLGAFLEKNYSLYVSIDTAKIYIPGTQRKFIIADIRHHLRLLRGNFITNEAEGSSDPASQVMATFSPRVPNGNLFHKCFGHLGQETTNEMLQGDYAIGLKQWNGTMMRKLCDSCLKR
ncbi:hypothetical protein BT96DRAFT_996743 [Gymnopus androsaceus JB14]|uniref:GAG-pre-integrase domain-containing protein n=1 Tax=Gymnopus androsaceus JB14 TaxID=1447944 RepID=A0A6A4HGP9_9AGAR|nr:hypothetical protein BT96DRAFT_996743 [Gymnopus androsaceus JB14]